jgi:hypothetical protein
MWKVETPPPSRWLEECSVEAFSIRGIALLAGADHVSLQASRGDRIGLIGHNGSGKDPDPVSLPEMIRK